MTEPRESIAPYALRTSPLLNRNPPRLVLRRTFPGWGVELIYDSDTMGVFPHMLAALDYARDLDHVRGYPRAREWYVKHAEPTTWIAAQSDDDSHCNWIRTVPLEPRKAVRELYIRHPYLRDRDKKRGR